MIRVNLLRLCSTCGKGFAAVTSRTGREVYKTCADCRDYHRGACAKHRSMHGSAPSVRRSTEKLRIQLKEMLGGRCAGCDETNFDLLCVDHINGGGTEDRMKHGGATGLYRAIVRERVPLDNYRLLCFNCNHLARLYGPNPVLWPGAKNPALAALVV